MWGLVEVDGSEPLLQLLSRFNLTGMTLLETNAARLNERLRLMGKREISAFHQEARTLPGGRIAVCFVRPGTGQRPYALRPVRRS